MVKFSNFNSTDRGSIVKALTDQSLHPYFGVVNFFFDADTIIDSVILLVFYQTPSEQDLDPNWQGDLTLQVSNCDNKIMIIIVSVQSILCY